MKRYLLLPFLAIASLLTGCSTDSASAPQEANLIASSSSIKEFEIALTSVAPRIKEITNSPEFIENPRAFEEQVTLTLKPLVEPSLRLMAEADINDKEVPELAGVTLDDGQIAQIGILIYANQTMAERNSVADCVARAFVGFDLHEGFWKQFGNRRLLLRAIGKVATRYLGAIGAILIVADFVDCMGWLD